MNVSFDSRLKAQYDNELREMEHMQATNRDKCADMRTKLAESDGTIQNLQATVKQLELQLEHSKKVSNSKRMNKRSIDFDCLHSGAKRICRKK